VLDVILQNPQQTINDRHIKTFKKGSGKQQVA
jgi:hypothetical protein